MVTLAPITATKQPTESKSILEKVLFKAPTTKSGKIATSTGIKSTKEFKDVTVKQAIVGTTIAAAATAAVGAVAIAPAAAGAIARTVAQTAVKTAIKKPVQTIAVAGIVAAGAGPTIAKTVFTAGKTAGEVITGEKQLTAETITDVAKGLGIAAGVGAAGVAAGYIGKKILEGKTETLELPKVAAEEGTVITATKPTTPETVSLEEPTPIKTATEPRRQTINQRVDINISQKNKNNSPSYKSVKYINVLTH